MIDMEHVNVYLNDDRQFQKVVLLVDRPDFLQEVNKLRTKWHLESPLNRFLTTYNGWQKTLARRRGKKINRELSEAYVKIRHYLDKKEHLNYSAVPPKPLIQKLALLISDTDTLLFYWDVYNIKTKFLAPANFIHVIGSAIACNKVTGNLLEGDTYYQVHNSPQEALYIGNDNLLISIKKDVSQSQALTVIKKIFPTTLLGRKKLRKVGTSLYDVAQLSSVRQMRKWYWESLDITPAGVVKKYNNYPDGRNIYKSIRKYKKLLERPLLNQ